MKKTHDMIVAQDWSKLLSLDELSREMATSRVLNGFKALQPNFAPTFKRQRNTAVDPTLGTSSVVEDANYSRKFYDKKRLPSYTDRILYKSMSAFAEKIKPEFFEAVEATMSSDHKPVRAGFKVVLPGNGVRDINVSVVSEKWCWCWCCLVVVGVSRGWW